MSFFIGISGGHHRSQAIALRDTQVVATAVGESLQSHIYGFDTLVERTRLLLSNVAADTGHSDVDDLVRDTRRVTISLPGVTDERPLDHLASVNWRTPDCLQVVDDTCAGLIGGALDRTGICAIAGTGASVCIGLGEFPFPLGKSRKLDGFGAILGDWGSGFRLATRYLEEYGRHYDRFGNPELIPLFHELLAAQPNIKHVDGLQNWFDVLRRTHPQDWPVHFAEVAAVVTSAAEREKPDPFAVDLVRQSARELARTIQIGLTRAERVLRKKEKTDLKVESLKVVCLGGQFLHSKVYFQEVKKAVAETHPANEVILAKFTPVVGAVLMAYAEDRILPPPECTAKIGNSILAHPAAVQHGIAVPHAPVPSLLASAGKTPPDAP